MNCRDICELLTAYLDGEVTPEERAQIEMHLPGCPQCRAEMEALSAMQGNLCDMLKSRAEDVSPSPQAWERVKDRLDTKAKGGWLDGLRHLLTTGKRWQVATVTVAVIIVAVVAVVWQFGGEGQAPAPVPAPTPAPTSAPSPAPLPTLQVSAVPAQDSYLLGEKVDIEFSFTNTDTDESITVTPFPPEIQIMLPRPYEVVRSFASGEQELMLKPGESMTYNLTWDQQDDNEKQVTPGWYYVDVKDITATRGTRTTQWSFGTVAKLLIRFPQGAIERSFDINQPQAVNGLTITLKRVELTATGARFYAFTIPPGYSPPEQPGSVIPPLPHPPPPEMVPVHAEYTVDGATKDVGYSGIGSEDNGIRLIWDDLDPVPSDAKELTFIITHFGDWEGPWEFTVPLE